MTYFNKPTFADTFGSSSLFFHILASSVPKIKYFLFHMSSVCSVLASKTNFSLRSVLHNVLVMLHNLLA